MKRVIVLFLVVIVLTGCPLTEKLSASPAIPLWNGTTVGMSIDEVQGLFPDMTLSRVASTERMAILMTESPTYKLNGIEYVLFHFVKDRLLSVRLQLSDWEFIRSSIMIAKYGPYVDYFTYGNRDNAQETWTWINGKTLIMLTTNPLRDEGQLEYIDIDSIDSVIPSASLF